MRWLNIEETIKAGPNNRALIYIVVIGLLLGICCAASFYIGAATICENSGGMMFKPLACYKLTEVKACTDIVGNYVIEVPTGVTE